MRVAVVVAVAAGLGLAGCGGDRSDADGVGEGAPGAPSARAAVEPLPAGAVRIPGKNFHVDAAPATACAGGGACRVLADLTSLGDYKVNKDYPFRFIPDAASRAVVDGEATFALTGTHSGRLTVPVKAGAATGQVTGTFKLSVCSADVCQVEDLALAVALPTAAAAPAAPAAAAAP